jgi:hypothetical protein
MGPCGRRSSDKVKAELMSDDRRKVNDVSECLCGSGALMVSVGNVNVVAVSNWDDAEGSDATRKECGEREVKIIRRKGGRERREGRREHCGRRL